MIDFKNGLSSAEADARLKQYGFNEIGDKKLTTALENAFKVFMDPMGLMLLLLGVVYWILDMQRDATILFVAYVPIVGVDVLLELRSQKALRSLKKSLKSTCHVIRDGKTRGVSIRDLVPGDLLLLEEGQTLPADGQLVESSNLTIDESSVTGESVPIEKSNGTDVLSGTTVLTGTGLVEVDKTGFSSQIGSIAKVLKEFEAVPSPLLRTVRKVVRIIFLIAICLAVVVFTIGMLRNQGFSTSLISALTLAMAAIPEEFPLVFTLYLSLAAYRLSKKGILVKSLPAVEGLGRVDVICTDKTGTLTEGKFRLDRILKSSGSSLISDEEYRALVFSCEPKAVDAMELSIFEWLKENKGADFIDSLHSTWKLQFDYPFETKDKYMSHVWSQGDSDQQVIAMKGSLEGVLAHCQDSDERQAILDASKREAEAGKRLLGLAAKTGKFTGNRETDEKDLRFIGILSFTDPVRPSVKEAIRACVARGIRIKMLTGDHLLTAHAIADKIDLPHQHDELFTGPDLEKMQVDLRHANYRKGAIFARLKPEQKLELIQALKAGGDIVAMTGDGINDAPALKLADVGISMGERATDVARSTAQLVLLKNDFAGIVLSVIEGQRVLKSLSESFGYLIAFHVPIIGIALYQSFFLTTPILLPIHIVLMELIVHPVSAFVFDEPHVDGPLVRPKEFIRRKNIFWSVLRGVSLTFFALAIFYFSPGEPLARSSMAVLALVLGNVGLLFAEKGGILPAFSISKSSRALFAAILLVSLACALAFVPFLAELFSLIRPSPHLFLVTALIGIAIGTLTSRR